MQEMKTLKTSGITGSGKLKPDLRPVMAFFITLVLYVALAVICRKYPFGDFSVNISDLEAQYAPFLALFRGRMGGAAEASHPLSFLMYSFGEGLGSNYMSMFGYYLASPFNLLYGLFDVTFIDGFVLMLMVLKMSFASAFMCKFISERAVDRKAYFPIMFGVIYAFSSYAIAYLFQIMWLDGYMYLPLLLYFVERYIAKGKKLGIIITLFLLFLSNYYIAYMAGIYSFIYLVVRMAYLGEFKEVKKAVIKIVKFVLMAVLDAMILCVILIPVGLNTLGNADPTTSKAGSDFVLYDAKDILGQIFNGLSGELGEVMPSNLPFLFTSTLITALIVLFFVSKAISFKDKIIYLFCLAGVYLSTAVYWFDVAWQVFDEPNWFWHRQTFVFIPLFMVIALKMYENLKKVTVREIITAFAILLGLLVIAQASGAITDDKRFLFNAGFIISIFAILFFMRKDDWTEAFADMPKILPFILGIMVCFEVVYIQPLLSTEMTALTLYNGKVESFAESIACMQELSEARKIVSVKNNAFRAEDESIADYSLSNYILEHQNMYGGYRGVTFFNSSSNKSLHRFLKQLGFKVNYNYFAQTYTYCAPDSDAFLSIGAVTTMRDYSNGIFIADDGYGIGYKYYANQNVLPLAFAASDKSYDFDFYQLERATEGKDYFSFRNLWYRSLFPEFFSEDYFLTLGEDCVSEPVITNGFAYDWDLTTMTDYLREHGDGTEDSEDLPGDTSSRSAKDTLGTEDSVMDIYEDNLTTYYRTNKKIPIRIDYKVIAPPDGEYYFNLSVPRTTGEIDVCVDNIRIDHTSAGTFFSQVYRIGTYKAGDEINVTVSADDDSLKILEAYFGYFDYEKFDTQFDQIDKSKVTVSEASDGYVDLTANIGAGETVITTIPYEDGWKLYVDGNEQEIRPYQNAFIAFDVPQGSHRCELVFTAPGFKPGAVVSVIGILGMLAFVIVDSKKNRAAAKSVPASGSSAEEN